MAHKISIWKWKDHIRRCTIVRKSENLDSNCQILVIQSLVGKGIVINSIDNKSVHIESWINLTVEDQSKWQKYVDVTDTEQLPQGLILHCIGTRATIRIDGIKELPEFSAVSMREITL
ncbi:MAG TPA: hypothetical protein VH796_07710 [Nitrososphaeraceae archaeon]|jgi:hypothetical protein